MYDINKIIIPPKTLDEALKRLLSILSYDLKDQLRFMDREEITPYFDSELSTMVKNAFDLQNNPELVYDCKTKNANDASAVIILALWWKLKVEWKLLLSKVYV